MSLERVGSGCEGDKDVTTCMDAQRCSKIVNFSSRTMRKIKKLHPSSSRAIELQVGARSKGASGEFNINDLVNDALFASETVLNIEHSM